MALSAEEEAFVKLSFAKKELVASIETKIALRDTTQKDFDEQKKAAIDPIEAEIVVLQAELAALDKPKG